jgi:phenolic acid decarboxylase
MAGKNATEATWSERTVRAGKKVNFDLGAQEQGTHGNLFSLNYANTKPAEMATSKRIFSNLMISCHNFFRYMIPEFSRFQNLVPLVGARKITFSCASH